ncbi:MAG: VacJ family lipoprotein [Erythrobacter sp.]|jgi:phospholipid-binding lipoprotein MlaA
MGVYSLALATALASVQPQCETGVACSAVPDEAIQAEDDAAAPPGDSAPAPAAEQPGDVLPAQDQPSDQPPGDTIVVTGGTPEGDPAQQLNAATFETVQKIDDAVVAPLAKAYDRQVPKPLRSGLRNFLRNLGEPVNFLNFMLQLKPGRALKSLGRFTINSTIGVAGLFEVAGKDPFNLRYEPNGLANTLGYYGVGPGPYLYLPFIGSTTLRDLFGRVVDISTIPAVAGRPFNQPVYAISAGALNSLESRILIDEQITAVRDQCGDAYSATRDIYLIGRQLEIDGLRGRESEELVELVERLKVNCDIAVIRAASEQARVMEIVGAADTPAARDEAATPPAEPPAEAAPVQTTPDALDPDPDFAARRN